ncbi:MAG: dienelactone hydrolase family protein [Ilumatobacteraceae bacterium]
MGDMIEITSGAEGSTPVSGYLATPDAGHGPGVVVVQEWWGLDSGIREICDLLAANGFSAFAPDLYHGELAGHTEMDRAGELMAALPMDRAGADMAAAVDALCEHPSTIGDGVGVIGFCMGGMLTFVLATLRPDRVKVAVPFYGFPSGDTQPDYSRITAVVRGHMAEHDDFFPPDAARQLEERLRSLGVDATLTVHPGTGHAFMAPHDALGTRNAELAGRIWPEVFELLRSRIN